ncbi:septum formation family protein [Micromonospora sp. DT47]|uniref:septum formation family protein n=1 Tax=Micromonospora sp. DT47 TaxID=3393431 RepID=UPI003CF404F9
MSPRGAGTLLMVLAATAVAGCDALPGRSHASGFVPQAGVCHLAPGDNASGAAYHPVDCSTRHEAETFLVSRFAGPDADSAGPPGTGYESALRAYASCATAAREFLGDWPLTGRVSLRVVLPTADGWAAAERWYRCDLVETVALDRPEPNPRANSLKDALVAPSPLRYGCFDPTFGADDRLETAPPASCTGPHHSEFVGLWWTDQAPDGEQVTGDVMLAGCSRVAAQHVGVSDEQELARRLEVLVVPPTDEEVAAGETAMLCFLHSEDRKLTRTLAGVGLKGLPAPR